MSPRANAIKRTYEQARNEPGLIRNILVVAGLVGLAVVVGGYIFSQARANWPWEQEFGFTATFDTAPAVSPGNGQEVRIAGVKVGEIRDADVNERGQSELAITIDPNYKVYEDAKLVLRPKSPLNEMYIEFSPGTPQARELQEGDILPATASVAPVQVDEVFGNLDANTQDALGTLLAQSDAAMASFPEALPPGVRATDAMLQRMQPLAEALQTRRDLIARLVTSLGTISATVGENDKRLADLATSMQKTLQTTGDNSEAVDAILRELPQVTDRLREATGGVQGLSDQLDPTLDNLREASATLPGALDRMTTTVDTAGEVVDKAAPVLAEARPVVADLRPLVSDLNASLPNLKSASGRLDELTGNSLPYLDDLQAFVFNTNSAYSLKDANGGILRGMQQYAPESVTGLLGLTQSHPQLFQDPSGAGVPPGADPRPLLPELPLGSEN